MALKRYQTGGWGGTWNPSAPSTSGDSADFGGEMTAALAGSDQSATTLDRLRQYMAASYAMGSAATNITVKATKAEFGFASEDGSSGSGGEVYWNASSAQTAVVIYDTKNTGTSALPPFNFKGTHVSNTMLVYNGTVGVATAAPADVATVVDLNVKGGIVTCGVGATLTAIEVSGGNLTINSAVTNLYVIGGIVRVYGTGKVTNLYARGGTVYLNNRPSSGNIVDALHMQGGIADFTENSATFAVGATTIEDGGGGIVLATPGQGTFTGGFVDSLTKATGFTISTR